MNDASFVRGSLEEARCCVVRMWRQGEEGAQDTYIHHACVLSLTNPDTSSFSEMVLRDLNDTDEYTETVFTRREYLIKMSLFVRLGCLVIMAE